MEEIQHDDQQLTALVGKRVDDVKMSHVEQSVLDSTIDRVSERRGREAPLAVQRGPALSL